MSVKVMAVNAGSSSLKFKLFEMPEEKVITDGVVERIGLEDAYFTIRVNGEKKKQVPEDPPAAQGLQRPGHVFSFHPSRVSCLP